MGRNIARRTGREQIAPLRVVEAGGESHDRCRALRQPLAHHDGLQMRAVEPEKDQLRLELVPKSNPLLDVTRLTDQSMGSL